jgi:hypothetical protein
VLLSVQQYEQLVHALRTHRPGERAGLCLVCGTGWPCVEIWLPLESGRPRMETNGDRTLLSYEHGTRHLTALRLIELCKVLGVAAPVLLTQALQRARIQLAYLVLRIDLRFLLNDRSDKFGPCTSGRATN